PDPDLGARTTTRAPGDRVGQAAPGAARHDSGRRARVPPLRRPCLLSPSPDPDVQLARLLDRPRKCRGPRGGAPRLVRRGQAASGPQPRDPGALRPGPLGRALGYDDRAAAGSGSPTACSPPAPGGGALWIRLRTSLRATGKVVV